MGSGRPGLFELVIGSGAILGACIAQILAYRFIPFPQVLLPAYWSLGLALEGALAGALIANLGWTLSHFRRCLRRAARVAVAANALTWMTFLIVTPPLTPAEWEVIDAERQHRDVDTGMDLMSHEPVIVAGRLLGTYGSIHSADKPLMFFAGPAILWTAVLTVPVKYGPARATRGESLVIAAAGFVLSTAFWGAFAPVLSALVRWFRNRRRRQ